MTYPQPEVIDWPVDLLPNGCEHYFRPHIGGSQSPLTRTRKTYELSAPVWVMKLQFDAAWRGGRGTQARGARLETLAQRLKGGLVLARLWDFRRPYPPGLKCYYGQARGQVATFGHGETFGNGEGFSWSASSEPINLAAPEGATSLTFIGFRPGDVVFHAGDFVGGDDRIHRVMADAVADGGGNAAITIDPPLQAALAFGAAVTMRPRGLYQLMNESAGAGMAQAKGAKASYALEFEEWRP